MKLQNDTEFNADPLQELLASYADDDIHGLAKDDNQEYNRMKLPLPEFAEDTRESFGNSKIRNNTF